MQQALDDLAPLDKFGQVAVLYGGTSSERVISLRSGPAIIKGLEQAGLQVRAIDVQSYGSELVSQLAGINRVFNALHGGHGEDGRIQGLLECLGIAYTGSGVLGSALAFDKVRTKQIWQAAGISTPDYWVLDQASPDYDQQFNRFFSEVNKQPKLFPLIVKPVADGSSFGVNKIQSLKQLGGALEVAFTSSPQLLIERCIIGSEYTVGNLHGKTLPTIQIVPASGNYDFDAKYERGDTKYAIPTDLSEQADQELHQIADMAYRLLGCQGWGRLDVMRDSSGEFFCLEYNTVPGMTQTSLIPKACAALGMSFAQLCIAVLETSFRVDAVQQR